MKRRPYVLISQEDIQCIHNRIISVKSFLKHIKIGYLAISIEEKLEEIENILNNDMDFKDEDE